MWKAARLALYALALLYALLAGLRTVADFDSGWLLATGRYVVQHHAIPSTDVFSYTAKGAPWIYPPFGGVLFYWGYMLGGYAALSWMGAIACAATVALIAKREVPASGVLAIIAVPAIAFRTLPRAELFTTVLFAATLAILWRYFRTGEGKLWLLPVILLAWVNLHLGFVSGLALLGFYVGLEVLEWAVQERRAAAMARLRRIAPWLAGSVAVTLVNPWGWGIYRAVLRQNSEMSAHNRMITEWSGVRLNLTTMAEALQWRNPNSGFWWLLALAVLVVVIALLRKQFGAAVLVAAFSYEAVAHIRFQGVFAIVVVLIGGSLIQEAVGKFEFRRSVPVLSVATVLLVVFAGIRIADVVTSRAYLANGEISVFGAGPSWWFPERAVEFVKKNHLPANIFHDYDLGGYLAFRLGDAYPDYIDGRAIPFGPGLMERHATLMRELPESGDWQAEVERRGINTLILSTARYAGLNFTLQGVCKSEGWRPVYLDDVSLVAVRNTPQNEPLVQKFGIDCATVNVKAPVSSEGDSLRARAELYNYYANSGAILYLLSRDREAVVAYRAATAIFPDDPNLHLAIGQLMEADGNEAGAEQEYRTSLGLRQTDVGWYALARILARHHQYEEALHAVRKSADLATYPAARYHGIGRLYLAMKNYPKALEAFRKSGALARSEPNNPELMAKIFEGESEVYRAIGDVPRAIESQKRAVEFTPQDPRRQQVLNELLQQGTGQGLQGTQSKPQ
ncbi:MAG TPA: hypothetical protein VF135_04195 [Terriglobales bacterium]